MATYSLTSGPETITGTSGDDLFQAFVDNSGVFPASTLNAGDAIDGGGGFNTLVLEGGASAVGSPNTAIVGAISNVQKLVLVGSFDAVDAGNTPIPLDLSKVGGLQQLWLQDPSAYGLSDPAGNLNAYLTNVSGSLQITMDSAAGASAVLNYLPTVTSATVNLAGGSNSGAELAGAALSSLTLVAAGAKGQTDLAILENHHDAAGANLKSLTIDAATARAEVFNGGFYPLIGAILAAIYPGAKIPTVNGFGALTKVSVAGAGGAWVDLSQDDKAVTFAGGAGNDALLIDPTLAAKGSHWDGGAGVNVFALSLMATPNSAKTITPGTAGYAAINASAHFQQVGFLGDFARPIVVDAALVRNQHSFIVGQTSQFAHLTDADTVDFQLLNFTQLQRVHFTLDHSVDAKGHMVGAGTVSVGSGDFLQMAPLLKLFSFFSVAPIAGTAVFDSKSLYAKLRLSGIMSAEIDSAAVWRDAKGVAHGVTIDASKLSGALTVKATTALADTIIAGKGADTFVYPSAKASSGANCDTLVGVDFAKDHFDTPGAAGTIAAIDPQVKKGKLDSGKVFDSELATALKGRLKAHDAVLFTASSGTLAHQTFLVADLNGVAGYQAGGDLVLHLSGAKGALSATNFI